MLDQRLEQQGFLQCIARLNRIEYGCGIVRGPGGMDQGPYILGKARAAITAAGVDEMGADARITADTTAHLLDIYIEACAQSGQLIDEGDFRRQKGVGSVLAELGRPWGHQQHPIMVAHERGVQALQQRRGMRVVTAQDDPVRAHEVVDGAAFL
ncbi:hypothetical protein D9M71_555570 [compost metagenome]